MIILIEGCDGTGKETQANAVSKSLGFERISFPQYGTKTGDLIEAYLHGEVEMDAYAASAAYALDRVATMTEWKKRGSHDLVLDRYVFSNFAYQAMRLPEAEREDYIAWARDFEYGRLALPKPDRMVYLMWSKPRWKEILLARKGNKHGGRDIHEDNLQYLESVYDWSVDLARREGAEVILCDGLDIPSVTEKILAVVRG